VSTISSEALEKSKHAPAVPGVNDLFLRRWSPRAYSSKDVSAADLKALFEAARWSASSNNEQPWRFLVGRKGDPTYQKILNALVPFNQSWAGNAPILFVGVTRKTFTKDSSANPYHLHDLGAANTTLMLQATAAGLHAHSMAGIDRDQIRASFAIPSDYEVGAVTAVGYLGDPDTLPEQTKQRELATRERKPLTEIVFSDWEKPAQL
jgi:nitroreductase